MSDSRQEVMQLSRRISKISSLLLTSIISHATVPSSSLLVVLVIYTRTVTHAAPPYMYPLASAAVINFFLFVCRVERRIELSGALFAYVCIEY